MDRHNKSTCSDDGICDIDHVHGKWAVAKSIKRIVTKLIDNDDNMYAQVCSKFGDAGSKTTMLTDKVNLSLLSLPYQQSQSSQYVERVCKA